MTDMSSFAESIMLQKYSQVKADGTKETWEDIADRVATAIMGPVFPEHVGGIRRLIAQRKFMPGGRYLYAAGRQFQAVNNCLAGETEVITSDGIKKIDSLVGEQVEILDGNGQWVLVEGESFGKQQLFEVNLRRGRSTRSVFATAGHRWILNDGSQVTTLDLTSGSKLKSAGGTPYPRSGNARLSMHGVQHGFVFGDGSMPSNSRHPARANFAGDKDSALIKFFPDMKVTGSNVVSTIEGLPRYFKKLPPLDESLTYLYGWLAGYLAADGNVSQDGVVTISSARRGNLEHVMSVCARLGIGTFSISEQEREGFGQMSKLYKLGLDGSTLTPEFFLVAKHRMNFEARLARGVRRIMAWTVESVEDTNRFEEVFCFQVPTTHSFVLEGGILTGNCFLLRAEDSREGWAKLMSDATHCLMSGGGIGVNYSRIRPYGATVGGLGGICTGPIALMEAVNETARQIQAGGSRRAAVYASLPWWHPDALAFVGLKDWSDDIVALKSKDFNARAPMDMTNISVALDDDFFAVMDGTVESVTHTIGRETYTVDRAWAEKVYAAAVRNMLTTGEPGFQIDTGAQGKATLRNACAEVVSEDNMDVCNLGSLNLSRFTALDEFAEAVELATAFLLAGTIVGDLPNAESVRIREKNRRLGLGIMGLYSWLVQRSYGYEPNDELADWLAVYQDVSDSTARTLAARLKVQPPKGVRAVAPTGTIAILAETESGMEPLFAPAFKRRYLKGATWHHQYVVDAGAQRLVDQYGVRPNDLETAYDLAYEPERRIAMQAFLQQYVDQAISSTLNLPAVSEHALDPDEFGAMLYRYLPKLRGLTAYPDGARGGQPLTVVPYAEAVAGQGVEFEEIGSEQACKSGVCGI